MEARAIPILDVRSPERFRASHLPDAVNIPLAALEERLHELPAPGPASPLLVVYSLEEEQLSGAAPQAHATLGNAAKYQCQFRDWEAEPAGDAVPGKQVRFLWSPNPALVHLWPRMQAHWDGQTQGLTALDLAAGNGRDAVLLARHGVSVWAIDYQERQLRKIEELQQFFRDEMREDIVQAMVRFSSLGVPVVPPHTRTPAPGRAGGHSRQSTRFGKQRPHRGNPGVARGPCGHPGGFALPAQAIVSVLCPPHCTQRTA